MSRLKDIINEKQNNNNDIIGIRFDLIVGIDNKNKNIDYRRIVEDFETIVSDYFDNKYSTEKEYRFGAEVGVLFFLLKGGLIQFVLYMLILLIAIYRCLFFSQSKCVVLIGLVLLSHYVLLFIEEVPHYDLYNIAIWLYVGMASSASIEEQDEASLEEKFDLIFSRK